MDEKDNESIEFEEPLLEDFFIEEVDPDREQKKKRRKRFVRFIAGMMMFAFLISSFSIFTTYFNLPALKFLKVSYQLSKKEEIQRYKKAVVSIEGNNSKGTGFNISKEGTIITNFHVIKEMKTIFVYFSDEQVFKASVIHSYPEVDLAILEIEGHNLPVLPVAGTSSLHAGDDVYVIGNPLAFYQIANQGEIIGLTEVENIEVPVLKITAPVYRGNSGSPLIDHKGEVIGVVFATTIPRVKEGEEKAGLVIPIEELIERLHL